MREMSQEQAAFLRHLNSDEVRKANEALEAARQLEIAESSKRWELYLAECDQRDRETKEAMRPLMDAMKAAGIKLWLSSYEGVWGEYQIGNGPVVNIDLDNFNTDEDEC